MPTVNALHRRVAVIPTRGNRPDVLGRCLQAIAPQVDKIVLIDNSDGGDGVTPGVLDAAGLRGQVIVFCDPEQPPNLSRLWNVGIEAAETWHQMRRFEAKKTADLRGLHVAVLNDDAIVPPYWFDELAQGMVSSGAVAAGYNHTWALHKQPGPTRLDQRMPGHAFITDRAPGLYADDRFRWWCGDNDLDMQHRRHGGTLVLPDDPVQHLHPDQSTVGVLAEQTGKDMAAFVAKWGFRPW